MPLFTVLPVSEDPNAEDAPAILRGIVAEPVNVVYVLLGRPDRVERMLEVAIGRAEAFPSARRVVHAPDPDVLDEDQVEEIRGPGNHVGAVYGLKDKVAARLKAGDAVRRDKVELAFTKAEEA